MSARTATALLVLTLGCTGVGPAAPTSLADWPPPPSCVPGDTCLDIVIGADVSMSMRAGWSWQDDDGPPLWNDLWSRVEDVALGLVDRGAAVGLIEFGGVVVPHRRWDPLVGNPRRPRNPRGTDAAVWTRAPLTTDRSRLVALFGDTRLGEPFGYTPLSWAIELAVRELGGHPAADSRPREGARRYAIFVTDGPPTLPHPSNEIGRNLEAVEAALDKARVAEVTIFLIELRGDAKDWLTPLAPSIQATGGERLRVASPDGLPTAIDTIVKKVFNHGP